MKFAPIALFTYNRPWHTRQTVEALLKNEQADKSELIVFSDGPKTPQDEEKIDEVRQYVSAIHGFQNVKLIKRSENMGLGNSIINGVTEVLAEHEQIIVLEDDLVTSSFFLRYMNEALELYQNEEKVISIYGYAYPVTRKLPATFFLRGADCLGWGTWKRGWALFEENGQKLLDELKKRKLMKQFDFDEAYRYTRMLKDQIAGRNTSWAVRWYASAFLRDCLTLYPGVSMIQHIGNDGSGTNFGVLDFLDTELAKKPLIVEKIEIAEDPLARRVVADYLRTIKTPFIKAVIRRGKKMMKIK